MVKKYFRKNILAACLVLSMTVSSTSPAIAAENLEVIPEIQDAVTETVPASEATEETPPESQSESEKDVPETQKVSEAPETNAPETQQAQMEIESSSQTQREDMPSIAAESKKKVSFSYNGIHMDGPEQLKEGDTITFSLKGMKGENVKKITIEVQTPEEINLRVGELQADGAAMETKQEDGKTILVITSEKGLFAQTADLELIGTIGAGIKNSEIAFTFHAFDMNDVSVFEDTKSFALTAQEELSNSVATLTYDKKTYKRNETIRAAMDQLAFKNYSRAEIVFELPEGAEFVSMQAPGAEGATVGLMYQDADGNWNDYSTAVQEMKAVKAVFTPNENVSSIKQSSPFFVDMIAKSTMSTSTKAISIFKNGEQTDTKEAVADLVIDADLLKLSMNQNPEIPSKHDKVTQHVKIGYVEDTNSSITYVPDKALTLDSVSVPAGSYLDGAKLIVTNANGKKELTLTGTVDLSSYKNISSFTVIPPRDAYAGNEAAFDVSFQITDEVHKYTCTVTAEAGKDTDKSVVTTSLTSNVAYTNLDKPVVLFESQRVNFGDSFQIGFGEIDMKNHTKAASMEWNMGVPSFMSANSFVVPVFKEKVAVELYTTSEKKETKIGIYHGGETVELDKQISNIRMVISSDETSITQKQNGFLTMTNNIRKNKKNYFGFRATTSTQDGGSDLVKSSDIRGVTFEVYKSQTIAPEPTKPPIPNPNPNPGTGTSPETPSTEPETQESENNEEFDKRKEEEKKRKEQAKKNALIREQKLKERQKSLLKDRISAIRDSALTERYSETEIKKDSWNIQPIKENLIRNLIPQKIQPISEKMISNLIPQKTDTTEKTAKDRKSDKMTDKKINKKANKESSKK